MNISQDCSVETAGGLPGLSLPSVSDWLRANASVAVGPLEFQLIAGGLSNLTYEVTDQAGNRFVLRRPPVGERLPTAHDVQREFRIISALHPTTVPVPAPIACCTDGSVTGAVFYVMAFIEGQILRTRADSAALPLTAREQASRNMVHTLHHLHQLDPAAVELTDLGRATGYIERQLKRWRAQYDSQHTARIPALEEAHRLLVADQPPSAPGQLVHGDFRIDNCLIDQTGAVTAVLDWELCTLGEPLADLATLLIYWTGPDDSPSAWDSAPTSIDGYWNRDQLAHEYAVISGTDLSHLSYYLAFAHWRLACILEGVHYRTMKSDRDHTPNPAASDHRRRAEQAAHLALVDLTRR